MKKAILLSLIILLTSCAPSYTIFSTKNDKFADEYGIYMAALMHNTIYPIAIGQEGTSPEINPYIFVNRKDETINEMGLKIRTINSVGSIHIQDGNKAIILADTNRIIAFAQNPTFDVRAFTYHIAYYDEANYPLTLEQMEKIANAKTLNIRIIGAKGLQDIENEKIERACLKNIKKFFNKEILPRAK